MTLMALDGIQREARRDEYHERLDFLLENFALSCVMPGHIY